MSKTDSGAQLPLFIWSECSKMNSEKLTSTIVNDNCFWSGEGKEDTKVHRHKGRCTLVYLS